MSEVSSILTIFRACCSAFTLIASHDAASRSLREWADGQLARLRVWADSLGVNARGRLSIAWRLRLNEPMAMMIIQLLEGLDSCLKSLLEEISQTQDHRKSGSPHDDISRPLGPEPYPDITTPTQGDDHFLSTVQEDAKENIYLLLGIAADLRKLGTHKEEVRALKHIPVDEAGESLLPAFEEHVQAQCHAHIAQCRAEVRDQDGKEKSVSLRRDEWQRKKLEEVELDADTRVLLQQLQLVVTQRWRVLSYRQHHARSLARNDKAESAVEEPELPEQPLPNVRTTTQTRAPSQAALKAVPQSTTNKSEATELTIGRMPLERPKEPNRGTNATSAASHVALNDEDLPPAPKITGPDTSCPLCWIPIPSQELRGSSWKSHVLRDLAPYFCVFTDCPTPDARYSTSKLLRQHMDAEHTHTSWTCPRCPDDTFGQQRDFENHLRVTHESEVSKTEIALAVQYAVLRKPRNLEQCVFCHGHGRIGEQDELEHWSSLVAHMTRDHMQSLAMLSLPWNFIGSDAASSRPQSGSASSGSMDFKWQALGKDPVSWPDDAQGSPTTTGTSFHLKTLGQLRSSVLPRQACQEWLSGLNVGDVDVPPSSATEQSADFASINVLGDQDDQSDEDVIRQDIHSSVDVGRRNAISGVDFDDRKSVGSVSLSGLYNRFRGQPESYIKKTRYRFGRTLGAGAHSVVKEAVAPEGNVAVKVYLRKNKDAVKAELEVLTMIKHPHIVCLIDWFESKDKIYMVVQLASGGELYDRVVARGRYPEKDAAPIMRQVLNAVCYLHQQDIVHRDIKPEKILFLTEHERSDLILSGFGIARRLDHTHDMLRDMAGSFGYAAPEVMLKKGHGKPADMWSIGVVLYCLLSGYNPFRSETMADLIQETQHGRVIFHERYWRDNSGEAKTLILSLLRPDPAQRMTAAEALRDPWIVGASRSAPPPELRAWLVRARLKRGIELVRLALRIEAFKFNEDETSRRPDYGGIFREVVLAKMKDAKAEEKLTDILKQISGGNFASASERILQS